ncbi:MAG TPA: cysteine synthase A [Bacilli bacterium]|nr:cysteine synthase A [Bacilli bacterium]
MIVNNIIDLIGNTPIVKHQGLFIKLEYFNASGSVKDRPAKWMIEGLEKDGHLKPGDVIVEPTSGNTGISLAMIGAAKGYKVVLVMPESMSVERRQVMKAYGAEIILTSKEEGMAGAVKEAKRLVVEKGYVMPSQFDNYYNVMSHIEGTANEIMNDFEKLDYVVCGIGTGGTITGLGKVLKNKYPNLKLIGVEPVESPIITKGTKGSHGIQGIGAGFIPSILDLSVVDEVRTISTEEARQETKRLAKEGLFLGVSSGAAIKVGYSLLKEVGNDKIILVIAPDGGLKYLSLGVFDD